MLEERLARRAVLQGGLGAAALAFLNSGVVSAASSGGAPRSGAIGFESVSPSFKDAVVVPKGYRARVLIAWGDPVSDGPEFRQDASHSAADQARQLGMHCDGMHYFPLGRGSEARGLLAINHEYTDEGLLHSDGLKTITAEKVRKSQAAHGVSIVEVRRIAAGREASGAEDGWTVVRPSRYARRITAYTPMEMRGPVRGSAPVRTGADPKGVLALGTLNNCASGPTPWGTYLTCEENWSFYFASSDPTFEAAPGSSEARYGLYREDAGFGWHVHDPRFDMAREPNEPNRFGWVVEIDPFDPASRPKKRTALGRFKHEGATLALAADGRAVVYMGDDERFEYLYKFVSRRPYRPGDRRHNADLLDEGTLYAARFDAAGTGEWLELVHGRRGLDEAGRNPLGLRFTDQADVLVRARHAADAVGATRMDRPEWVAVHPVTGEAYVTLTNNGGRREGQVDAANPRQRNIYGHIVRWREAGGDAAAARFEWDVFVQAGDPSHPLGRATDERQAIHGDLFACPDGLRFDAEGRLWIQTDASSTSIRTAEGAVKPEYAAIGHNQMLCADVETRQIRRFLTGPQGCEVTGMAMPPDGRSMFVGIQHPGEPDGGSVFSDPANPKRFSSWPDGEAGGRPRSAVVVVTREDDGPIGS